MLLEYLGSFELAPVFTEEEVLHYLMPVEGVIETHVVEGKGEPCRHCFHAGSLPAAAHCNFVCKPTNLWTGRHCCTCKTHMLEVLQHVLLLLALQNPRPLPFKGSKKVLAGSTVTTTTGGYVF